MKKIYRVLSLCVMAGGCVPPPTQYQSLSVILKDNAPCFIIPENPGLDKPITSHAPTVMKKEGSLWEPISPPATWTPVVTLTPGECRQWDGIEWQAGEYDVVLKITGKNNAVRYATRFILQKNTAQRFEIIPGH